MPEVALTDKLDGPKRKPSGTPCSIGKLLDELPPDESAALHTMLFELGWSWSKIAKALKDEGHEFGQQTINRHRSSGCRCYK